MPRFVSWLTFAATFSTVRMLVNWPVRVARRIASPEAFIDAIERFAKH